MNFSRQKSKYLPLFSFYHARQIISVLFLAGLVASCSPEQTFNEKGEEVFENMGEYSTLYPLPGLEDQAPTLVSIKHVRMQTDVGDFFIEVYPEAAPNASQRFLELVESGFYNNTPVFRIVPGFVAQFGINWREGMASWQNNNFSDDPSYFALDRGTLAFAKAGPNTNSTQVFINYSQNNHLASPQYNFTAFAKVVAGMDVVDSFRQVGDPSMGLDQGALWTDGEKYLAGLPEKPAMILSASIE